MSILLRHLKISTTKSNLLIINTLHFCSKKSDEVRSKGKDALQATKEGIDDYLSKR
jgi:hypothetical protein